MAFYFSSFHYFKNSEAFKQNYLNGYPYSLVVLNRSTILQITPHYSELLLYFSSL